VASGPWLNSAIADTDPRSGTTNVLRGRRSLTYLPPGAAAADADLAFQRFVFPLSATGRNRS